MQRRNLLLAGIGAAVGLPVALLSAKPNGPSTKPAQSSTKSKVRKGPTTMGSANRMPVIYLPHGGGPWPFVDLKFAAPEETAGLLDYLVTLPAGLTSAPKALLVVSAHWEERVPTLMTSPKPPMLYDYYGFPPESYSITWPAPGAPELARHVGDLLSASGLKFATDDGRGFDHGTFVPLKVSYPAPTLPTLQLSMLKSLDPAEHLALGQALAPLRDEGVLIIGSGMSYHDLRSFMTRTGRAVSEEFDAWLQVAATQAPAERAKSLEHWSSAPAARRAHPREEHLLPLMVAAGAADGDAGRVAFSGHFAEARITAFHYG